MKLLLVFSCILAVSYSMPSSGFGYIPSLNGHGSPEYTGAIAVSQTFEPKVAATRDERRLNDDRTSGRQKRQWWFGDDYDYDYPSYYGNDYYGEDYYNYDYDTYSPYFGGYDGVPSSDIWM